ncbi:hypothetical protein BDK51DRAFT_25930, partial [Blyttiomyces helicus]
LRLSLELDQRGKLVQAQGSGCTCVLGLGTMQQWLECTGYYSPSPRWLVHLRALGAILFTPLSSSRGPAGLMAPPKAPTGDFEQGRQYVLGFGDLPPHTHTPGDFTLISVLSTSIQRLPTSAKSTISSVWADGTSDQEIQKMPQERSAWRFSNSGDIEEETKAARSQGCILGLYAQG